MSVKANLIVLMQYLIVTCVISDFIKAEPGTQARIKLLLQIRNPL
jgi:hypothetical protein